MMPTAARVVAANAAATAAGCGELLGAQRGLDLAGAGGDVALPPTAFERGLDRGQAQVGALLGGRGATQHPQGIAVGQVLEGLQRGRVVLAQRAAQRVGVPGACPDQVLMCPGEHLDRLRVGAVAGDRAMVVPVGADQIGQQFGVAGIGFGARRRGGGRDSGPPPAG